MLCDETIEVHCAGIYYHSHTYIRHRDIASLLPRHTSVNTYKHAEGLHFSAFINPRRACAARVTVVGLCVCLSVCLFVCLSVDDYSRTTGYEAAYERY